MLKVVFFLLLASVSNNVMALADKIEIGKGFGTDRVYVYADSYRRAGTEVTMWSLFDSSTPQKLPGHKPYLSKVTQLQYECMEKRLRILYTNYYAKNDSKGEKIFFDNTSTLLNWQPIVPGTANAALFDFACKKKAQ